MLNIFDLTYDFYFFLLDKMKPGNRIKKIIAEVGGNQSEFAESIGVHSSSLSAVLSGKNRTTKTLANSIELVHGYSANWILNGEEPRKAVPRRHLKKNDKEMWELLNVLDEKLVDFSKSLVLLKSKIDQVQKD